MLLASGLLDPLTLNIEHYDVELSTQVLQCKSVALHCCACVFVGRSLMDRVGRLLVIRTVQLVSTSHGIMCAEARKFYSVL
jgi:hypothetical protein